MKWRSRQRAHTRSEKPGDEVNMHGGSWDATRREAALDSPGIRLTPSTSQEGNAAMAVAREAETAQDRVQQIEERIFLTETAMKLRVALFPEIFCPTERAPPVSCSGSAIVEKLITLGFAATPEDAVVLANRLVLVGALFGTGGPTIFIPSAAFRYRFAVDRYAQLANGRESDQLVDGTRVEGAMGGTSSRRVAELAQSMQHPVLGVSRSVGFEGREAVNWLINNNVAGTRQDAVRIASALVRAGVFFADHCNFVDGETCYYFSEDSFKAAARRALRC